ncbi:MAG: sigma-70 family RNA polymerase sigma factor [Candidatus Cloacimonetes bacterium]|nr:sigma-70 family RNA polymerase sigma factor [Candidatus Cloacimonadota bacterium]
MSIYSNISDKKLVSLYKEKERKDIMGELYKRYTQFVFLISMKYLKDEESSKDSVMQIFEKLFSDLLNHKVDNFKSWLYMVTRNHCLMQLRKSQVNLRNRVEYKKDTEDFMEIDLNSHLKEKETEENKIETVQDAVNQLNKEQKECVNLFYLQGKSYQETAELTSYSIKNVKSYIQNGKRNLKNILTKAGISAIILFIIFIL